MYGKLVWNKYEEKDLKECMDFAEGYKHYISVGKTERTCTNESVKMAKQKGFTSLEERIAKGGKLKAGEKLYSTNMGKNVVCYVIGKKPLMDGLRILGAHIDSPRIDVKQNPLYEKDGFAMMDTHYYGGIKKYQWVTLPLALHGVVCKKDGTTVDICIGEDDNDPIVGINDLLIHLAADQMSKPAAKVIEGEALDIMVGSIPLKGDEKNPVKQYILKLLNEKYGIEEEDFLSAEIQALPQGKARDYGLDRSMVAGYGHDDRVCAYTSLMALLDIDTPEYTSCCILVDKEEVGSIGATGASSLYFENTILQLLSINKEDTLLNLRTALTNSNMLSSDVSAGVDPMFPAVNDPKNAAYLGKGIVFNKFTGSRGKSGCNDANPEYVAWLRNIMDSNDINFQTAELGKVDQGGGGTIAYILGNYNMNVIDAGVAVLNMHAPWEVISKADLHETYKAYKIFLTK
ncbi:MAG: aminopeptidase [bacterium]